MWGANTDELRRLGHGFRAAGVDVLVRAKLIGSEIADVTWVGRDAERFRTAWAETELAIHHLANDIDAFSAEIWRQAAEQDVTSESRGAVRGHASYRGSNLSTNRFLGETLAGSLSGSAQVSNTNAAARLSSVGSVALAPTDHPRVNQGSKSDQQVADELSQLNANGIAEETAEWFRRNGYDVSTEVGRARLTELGRKFPDLLGNLEGAPYVARDAANQVVLNREIDALREEQNRLGADFDEDKAKRLQDLEVLQRVLGDSELGLPRSLVELHVYGFDHVQASVGSGDLDNADSVTIFVPGMNNTVSDMEHIVDSAEAIIDAALEVETRPDYDYASIAFLNFDSPKGLNEEAWNTPAMNAMEHLRDDLRGLNAARVDNPVELNMVAHSYGTNVVHHALSGMGDRFGVDRVFFVGSSGLPDLPFDAFYDYGSAEQYTTEAEKDATAGAGRFWSTHWRDPARVSHFEYYDSTNGRDGSEGATRHDARGPGGYFEDDSENVRFIAEVISG